MFQNATVLKTLSSGDEADDVEDHRRREQPEWEHDQHRMNRMTEQLDLAFHPFFLCDGRRSATLIETAS